MTATPPRRVPRLRYPRERLYLGISGVGSAVLLASAVLASGVATRLFSTSVDQPLLSSVIALGIVFAVVIGQFILFDLIGGVLVVRHRPAPTTWLARWGRGVVVQWLVWLVCAASLMYTARVSGRWAAQATVGVFTLLQLVLAATRGHLARVVAALPQQPISDALRAIAEQAGLSPAHLRVVDSTDEGFVGGYVGITARTLLLPKRFATLPPPALLATLVRRRIIARSGAHLRGVLAAVLWNSAGLSLVLFVTHASYASVSGVVTLMAGMTLWTFGSVLLLPTLSRAAVRGVDAEAAVACGRDAVRAAIEALDRWQDDEASRSRVVETIFHPVPARSARIAQLAQAERHPTVRWWHLHHVARHALWLTWASMTPLSCLVHCNVGRPALWVMLPGD